MGGPECPMGFSYSTAHGILGLFLGAPGTGKLFKESEIQEEDKASCRENESGVLVLFWTFK